MFLLQLYLLIIIMKNQTRSEMSAVNGNIETCKNHLKKLETIAKKIRKRRSF